METKSLKLCTRCKIEKFIGEFSLRKNSPDGHRGVCKECRNKEHIERIKLVRSKPKIIVYEIKCTKCGIIKDINNFHKNLNNSDGYCHTCKKCHKQYIKSCYGKIKTIRMEKKCNECGKIKSINDFSESKSKGDGHRSKCKECINKRNNTTKAKERKFNYYKKRKENNRERTLINRYKSWDKDRNFICDLTENWVKENIMSKPCMYCGETNNIGCDRINNKGHTIDNVIPCCPVCNMMRGDNFSVEEMIRIGVTVKLVKQDRPTKDKPVCQE
jgi:hypothetical protein